mgnify:CR=1 FL=1
MAKFDFSGWATANDYKCADGRTIRRGAFADMDGKTVPLVWGHQHDSPTDVLGHALLENRDEGVYMYGSFNNSAKAQDAKEAVQHGDIKYLSIYANHLKQSPAKDVLHGVIREVSLVYGGANPGAFIDNVALAHSDGSFEEVEDEAIMCFFKDIELEHSDNKEKKGEGPMADKNDEKKNEEKKELTVEDVYNEMTEDQKAVCQFLINEAVKAATSDEDDEDEDAAEHSDFEEEGDDVMKHNVFDGNDMAQGDTLTHDEMSTIIADAKRYGSLKDSFLAHADDYGIEQIDWLFPSAKEQNTPPEWIKRPDNWVNVVMSGVHHTPFTRLKSTYADITEDEARARGYLKGRLKKEEVFSLLKRTTQPTTVYKKQKLDRDDTIDITDFDVIAWLKAEMRMMLDEELAAAYLVGDGRLASDDDKIDPTCIRPIVNESDLFNIKYGVAPSQSVASGTSIEDAAQYYAGNFIKASIRARKGYKGSGSPTMFTSESMLCEMLLLEDTIGHPLYKTEGELATKCRVSRIVTIPDEIMARASYNSKDVLAIIVNLADYSVGADKGGSINMFDDFDIDYNQMKYLIETRCSGSLMKPFSAITLYADSTTGRTSKIVGDSDFDSKSMIGE